MKEGLSEHLKQYSGSDFYPFHMPGHKRKLKSGILAEACRYDITEIEGFDNLHQPRELIRDAQERAARLYHSEETYFLINGSTAGILSAVSALAGRGNKLIIARNCHKAVYHAAFLNRMELHYVYPKIIEEYGIAGAVSAENLENAIKTVPGKRAGEGIAGVVITSPTYEGVVSDVKELAEIVHKYGIPLIVDQAHGAHFGVHPSFPENAVAEGADLVIHSIHKTMPAPTQTALLHRNGSLVSKEILRRYLVIYQTSSPSYLLMAGIDDCVAFAAREGYGRLEKLLGMRKEFLRGLQGCTHIRVCPFTEPGKLVIALQGISLTGQKLYDILREKYHLQMEMASGSYVVAILTMMDEKEGMERLLRALLEIDEDFSRKEESKVSEEKGESLRREALADEIWNFRPTVRLKLWEAYTVPWAERQLEEAAGCIAADFLSLYPPGIPILAPGEEIDEKLAEMILAYLENGYTFIGIHERKIKVVEPYK